MVKPQPILRICGPHVDRTGAGERILVLDRSSITIGRAADQDLVLLEPEVSRVHARIDLCPEGWVVSDVGSKAGIYVDGKRCDRAVLRDRQTVMVGRTSIQLVLDPHRDATVFAPERHAYVPPATVVRHDDVTAPSSPARPAQPQPAPDQAAPHQPAPHQAAPQRPAPHQPHPIASSRPVPAPMPAHDRLRAPAAHAPVAQSSPQSAPARMHAPIADFSALPQRAKSGYELDGVPNQQHQKDDARPFSWNRPAPSSSRRSPSFTANFDALSDHGDVSHRSSATTLLVLSLLAILSVGGAAYWWAQLL